MTWTRVSTAGHEPKDRAHSELDVPAITKSVVNHVQTSLARQAYKLDNLGAYQAAALSVRDNLIVSPPDFSAPTGLLPAPS